MYSISNFIISLRYRIVAAAAPGVASQDTPDGQIEAFDRTVLHDGLLGILATRGCKPARGSQQRGDAYLVKPDGLNQ